MGRAEHVVVVIGTPVDEHLNPDPHAVPKALEAGQPRLLAPGQLVVLRSTVYPGVTRRVEKLFADAGVDRRRRLLPRAHRRGQGDGGALRPAADRLRAERPRCVSEPRRCFRHLTDSIVELEPEEAELAKLFTNTWRYIKFAAANQFYVMANDHGLDYDVIRKALAYDYPRAKDMPGAGFAAGPCLFKDTMQLAAFTDNSFVLGHSAMLVNEGLPLYLVSRLEKKYRLENLTVGILGMAFKGESDDIRSSLSYKLRRILQFRAAEVLCSDPFVTRRRLAAAARRGHRAVRRPRHRRPPPAVPAPVGVGRGRRRVEPAREGHDRMSVALTVVIPAYNEGDAIVPVLDRIFDAVESDCEIFVVVDFPEDTTVPVLAAYREHGTRLYTLVNTYGRGPANAIRYGIDQVKTPVVVVTMADGSDDPRQIDPLARLVDRGVVVAAASRYTASGQQVGGPLVKGVLSKTAGRSLKMLARVGTHDATNSFKAYSTDFIREVGIHSRSGFEIGLELTAKARRLRRPVAEVPTIWLDRTIGDSNFDLANWIPKYLRWYRFAFGPQLSVDEVQREAAEIARVNNKPTKKVRPA